MGLDLGPRLFLLCIGYGWSLFTIYDYYFWIPIVGPIIGALIGSWVYKLFIGIHGLNEEIPISKQQKSDSTKSLIEPQTLSWRQTTIPPFPAAYSKPTETEPARTPSFFRDIRRDFDHRNAEEKVIDLTTEDSFKRTRAPSPPPSHEPPPPPVSSPATEPEGLRRLFETDRPVPFYRSVFEKKADGPLPTIMEVQRKAPEPVISTTTPARPWERDAERYSSAAPSEASVPSQRAPAPPQAPPRLHQQPESSSSYQRTDRDHIQVSLAYYRND
uniref:Serine protease n=1 Tax=Bursaphelenchus xylophilus TaxID=6326 RepID=A0A1I7RKB3_BURXY